MKIKDKKLYKFYEDFINIPLYRVVNGCDYEMIIKNGIIIKKNPYKNIKDDVIKLQKIIKKIIKNYGDIFIKQGEREVNIIYAIEIIIDNLNKGFIDFAPDNKSISYYLTLKGGAIINDLKAIFEKIKTNKIEVQKDEQKIIKKINNFINKRICKNKVIYISGSDDFLKNALFQPKPKSKKRNKNRKKEDKYYLESPFGDFEHFQEVITKHGLKKYSYYLRNKRFYLRVKEDILKEKIKIKKMTINL